MNNRKSKSKKRKLKDLENNSGDNSSDKSDNLDSDVDNEAEHREESCSESSDSSSESLSSIGSSVKQKIRRKPTAATLLLSDSSDSGDESCEKCAICLRSITSQEVGSPEVCDHIFCSVCITEWSKNSNVCPLDRQQFSIILVRSNKDGNIVKKVAVEEPQARIEHVELDELDDTVCEICGSGDREDILLLCDNCDRGFHTICLTPPLENIPDENEWFCPNCDSRTEPQAPASASLEEFFEVPSSMRSLRPRIQFVRTRLLERIRVTVNRIVENYVLQHPEELDSFDNESLLESETDTLSTDSNSITSIDQPGTSGLQPPKSRAKKSQAKTKTRRTTKSRKKTTKTRKRKTTKRRKTTGVKRKTKKRKTRVSTTRTKKIKVENEDGTITEKIVKTRTYKRRRQKRRKKKTKVSGPARRGLRVKAITTPKTVKGRLALTLGMVPPKKPGQLIPEIKARSNNPQVSAIDLNRSRAGIPKLHIFGPRDELQYYSSESENEDFIGSSSGGVATVIQPRTNLSRIRDRKKAALAFQSFSSAPKPKPVIQPPSSESVDILGSIMDSQAIWHSKKTNVKIKEDGSIEVIKDKIPKPEGKEIDVRGKAAEGMTTQAPMQPGAGSRPGGFRPYNRNNYGDSRSGSNNTFSPRMGHTSTGMNFGRFGGPPRNDREGYTNYLNNIPQGPTPFCRGGPPLRFRMPVRQQLRRITFPVRNRPTWQPEDDEEEDQEGNPNEKREEKEKEEEKTEAQSKSQMEDDDDIDLYSDIETNVDKTDNSGAEDGRVNYSPLVAPPEPSEFLLGLAENADLLPVENKDKSEVYDPAEPCDSDDEMVIDENKERSATPEEKKAESKTLPETQTNSQKTSSDDDDEDCPIFSIYSSATREFSQKEEEERQREIEKEKRKIEELKLQDEMKTQENILDEEEKSVESELPDKDKEALRDRTDLEKVKKEDEVKEKFQAKPQGPLSFDFESIPEEMDDERNSNDAVSEKIDDEPQAKVSGPVSFDYESPGGEKDLAEHRRSPAKSEKEGSSPAKSLDEDKDKVERSPSSESGARISISSRDKSSSPERAKKTETDSESEAESKRKKKRKREDDDDDDEDEDEDEDDDGDDDGDDGDDDKENEEAAGIAAKSTENEKNAEREAESETERVSQKVATGLEGLDVEEVSSDNGDGAEFGDKRSLSSLSLSELSNASRRSKSPVQLKKKKKNKKRKVGKFQQGKNYEEGEIDDSEKDNRLEEPFERSKVDKSKVGNENSPKPGDKGKRRSVSNGSERQVLGSKENKKLSKEKSKDKDLSWKKPSKKDKNYREGKRRSKDRGRSKSNERRKSRSLSPKKDKKRNKDRKKKNEKKKEIERYDVRKIVKNKEVRKTDAFGRDISKSRSISLSRSRSPVRGRSRNMLRRGSRSYSRSRSRSFRRGRSPVRRRYLRSRSRTRSKSVRRSYSRSRSRSRSRKSKKKFKSKDRLKIRSRSRGRKSRSLSRGRRRSPTRTRSRSPIPRMMRSKKAVRARRSWSHHISRSLSFSPRRSRSITRSPLRVRRGSFSRSISTSWSRGRSPLPRTSSLEKLTVVLTTKDKKKWKKKKDGKKVRKEEKRKKKSGNSKEVFASGDNVLVSVNFRNNSNAANNSVMNDDDRNTRLNSLSPIPGTETSRRKKKGSDYETERVTKKSKKSNAISKKAVDVALSNACSKRAKKLTRLTEKDAEVILNRKPVAVIDLDMSPYREQTPSPVNVVVVSDSGSGDEGKEHTPQRQPEVEKMQEPPGTQSVDVSVPSSPVENGYVTASGPKTPPEPQIKFSINKPQQLRPIANPLGDDDDDDDEEDEDEADEPAGEQMESLDRRIEKELSQRTEMPHKGPNTPPAPRGPSTPKTPPSPQTSPDAYDPFEPTKSRSPSPSQADKENRPSPKPDGKDDQGSESEGEPAAVSNSMIEPCDNANDVILENHDDKIETGDKGEAITVLDGSTNVVIPNQMTSAPASDVAVNDSPERKITVVISGSQSKAQTPSVQKNYAPVLKQLPMAPSSTAAPPTSANLTVITDIFSMPSPTKTNRSTATTATQSQPMTGIQRLQHRLGSPVNRTPNSVKSTPEKRSTPAEIFSSGNYLVRNASKRNGEQAKQPRPLQDATNETIDITMDLDDSPYSPASSEGDDLFEPPVETSKPSQPNSKSAPSYKNSSKASHKSPVKQLSKFDLLFGPSGPTLSPLKVGNKKPGAKVSTKTTAPPKVLVPKPQKKAAGKKNAHKMDEDQLKILDDLPSSAVELQVKDKFLKKLNRQERVVDEVKTVLKPHYARKHITKEEYKDILRRSVPKICHSRSGEINPSKIQSLIEAYVRKFRHAKKKGMNVVAASSAKPKVKKTMFS